MLTFFFSVSMQQTSNVSRLQLHVHQHRQHRHHHRPITSSTNISRYTQHGLFFLQLFVCLLLSLWIITIPPIDKGCTVLHFNMSSDSSDKYEALEKIGTFVECTTAPHLSAEMPLRLSWC